MINPGTRLSGDSECHPAASRAAPCEACRLSAIILYMTTCLPLAEVRDRLSPLVNSVQATHERVVITKNGHPAAVLISYDDFESLQETLEILTDPEIVDDIRAALADPERFTVDDIRRDLEARSTPPDGDR